MVIEGIHNREQELTRYEEEVEKRYPAEEPACAKVL